MTDPRDELIADLLDFATHGWAYAEDYFKEKWLYGEKMAKFIVRAHEAGIDVRNLAETTPLSRRLRAKRGARRAQNTAPGSSMDVIIVNKSRTPSET